MADIVLNELDVKIIQHKIRFQNITVSEGIVANLIYHQIDIRVVWSSYFIGIDQYFTSL